MNPKMTNLPSEEEFLEWLQHPVTEAFRLYLSTMRQDLMERWASGDIGQKEHFANAVTDAAAVGVCKAFQELVSLEYDQLIGVLSNESEHVGPQTPGTSSSR